MGLRDLLFGSKDTSSPDEYKDLTLKDYELVKTQPSCQGRHGYWPAGKSDRQDQVYDGNIVIVDITRLKMDKINYERVMKDFYQVARDVDGDIVGLGDQQYVIITPKNVKISRDRIGGVLSWNRI